MASSDLVMGTLFLFQTGVGLLGNSSLLYFYILTSLTKHTRPIDLILSQLALANSVVLFSKGTPQILVAFRFAYRLGEAECKVSLYAHRVARGVSLCSTCFLSAFQAITICSGGSTWAELKWKAPKFVQPSCSLCWVLHLLIAIIVPLKTINAGHTINITSKNFGLCSQTEPESSATPFYAFLFFFLDILFLGLTGWASGSIVIFLQRHKQRVQYIHHTRLSPRVSPETTATHTILLLVTSSVSFYSVSSILSLYVTCFVNPSLRLVNITTFLASFFPAFSPFVLISYNRQLFRTYFVGCSKMKIFK
ncbi:PREDICTED: vomeronasal type-1 receptor 1-like [Miniopterus natalensis]|uniref:vomeronasal type-1 receptor 1-like n=1 Tax=Miniopterus natalensis TaxID=291302 RepID=UPI0007A6CDD7|nr:PREDICTED: vomeronasal type-1 receptor 1-like [Miniopterus natalensis]XP_016074973.1 PREDICTED: vomeronasal type-1 receptor 1-like [Miniopterus natalensis]XP_016074974.1 PREDICTED: vomeronasal type-1 receptor 1-like [Miniopterus natalensis]